tara:strand:- start:269 stop:991 length:723 start_codon:yes stop_codon:yes gene_type:complete
MILPDFNQPAPRRVSVALLSKKLIWNTFTLVGIFFALFGGLFFSVFFITSHYNALDFRPASVKKTMGVVIDTRKTNANINKRTVTEVIYEFSSKQKIYRNRSYGILETNQSKTGSQVPVIFVENNPKVSRIEGFSSGKLSPVVYFIASIFPVIGLFFVVLGTFRTYGFYKILRYGRLTEAQIENVNERSAFFQTHDGSPYKVRLPNDDFTNQKFVEVIFLPNKPNKAFTIVDLEAILKSF